MSANSKASGREPTTTIESRYEIERTLGQGGAGIVYQVRDRESGERLALKKLLRLDLKSVTRLKNEFRSLADLHHPNLIKMYELANASDVWYITMEHLDGSDIMKYLGGEADLFTTVRRGKAANHNDELGSLRRLGGAFLQLARGIRALHRAGMLHRDLKPSNVMVARDRVVILDFGLVREVGDNAATITQDDSIAGTPAYMAPEQIENSVLAEATDWYAFGVMLYEALSGVLPHDGRTHEIFSAKLARDPAPIDQLVPGLPAELAALCMALLQRDPTARPSYEAIAGVLDVLGPYGDITTEVEQLVPDRSIVPTAIVGRKSELAQLEDCYLQAVQGRLVVAHVRGPSGAGKSALVEQFLDGLEFRARTRDLLVLRARCYEREAMPFKALDGLIDSLVEYLAREDEVVVSHLLPRHLPELTRAFPVLERLPVTQRLLATAAAPSGDVLQERTRAEDALRELLHRVARRRLIVLWIDDLQWGDLDSVSIVKSWLDTAEHLPIFIVFSYRSEEVETSACLKLLARTDTPNLALESFIDLAPLAGSDVEAMCVRALADTELTKISLIQRVISEAQGSPFLVRQLLTLARARIAQGQPDLAELSIDGVVSQLTALLGDAERALLNVVAVAGRPLSLELARRAAGIGRDGRFQLHALKSLSLTRMRLVGGQQLIEVYHDRVREAVLASLRDAERVETHRRLLSVLERSGQADPDWLHVVAVGAENRVSAARYGRAAAERAVATLAFERAVELYIDCIMRSESEEETGQLWHALGDALAATSRGSRAAAAYLEASRFATQPVAELTRLAAIHLICSGHIEAGEALVRKVLVEQQIRVPATDAGLVAAIGWERLRLAVRGLEFEARDPAATPHDVQVRGLTYGLLSIHTQSYSPLRAALFQARALRMALDFGDAGRVVSALSVSATTRVVSGSAHDERHAEAMLERAHRLATEIGDPLMHARVLSSRAMCAFLLGRPSKCLELWTEAERLRGANLNSKSLNPGEYYIRLAITAAAIGVMFQLGRITQGRSQLHKTLSDARATENRTAILHLSMASAIDEISQGHSAQARARLDAERPQLPASGFGPLHMLHMVAVIRVGCALGDYAWADPIVEQMWPRFERSVIRHTAFALLAYGAHARLLLNMHVLEQRAGNPRALIQRELRAMQKVSPSLSVASTSRFEVRLAYIAGDREGAIARCREHIAACQLGEYADEVERGRWALGQLVQRAEGAQLCADALAKLIEMGFVDPASEVRCHFPELLLQRVSQGA